MATLRDIRRRIRSVEKTQQITSAMRMVAAANLRRAHNAILAARPYARRMYATLAEIGRREGGAEHPLLQPHARQETLELIVVTSDRGLCGAFNGNALKRAGAYLGEQADAYRKLEVSVVAEERAHPRDHRGLVRRAVGRIRRVGADREQLVGVGLPVPDELVAAVDDRLEVALDAVARDELGEDRPPRCLAGHR